MTLARTTLSEQVATGIIATIREQGLRPGDEIAAEGELANRYGVNRLVVREAIRTLVAREILVSSQGKRARVSTPSPAVFEQILTFRLGQQSMDLDDLVSTRQVLEGEIAGRAARRVAEGRGDVAPVEAALAAMRADHSEREKFIRHDIDFHEAIAGLADTAILAFILSALHGVLLEARRSSYDARSSRDQGVDETIEQHQRILDALVSGDPDGAAAAMAAHLLDTGRDLGL